MFPSFKTVWALIVLARIATLGKISMKMGHFLAAILLLVGMTDAVQAAAIKQSQRISKPQFVLGSSQSDLALLRFH